MKELMKESSVMKEFKLIQMKETAKSVCMHQMAKILWSIFRLLWGKVDYDGPPYSWLQSNLQTDLTG